MPTSTYDPTRPLAIMHIPKTGGTALTHALAEALRPRNHIGGWDRSLLGVYRDFDSWPASARAALFLTPDQLPLGADLLSNHLARSTVFSRYPQAQLLTVLREPRSRLLSLWIFWRGLSGDPADTVGSYGRNVLAARGPLTDFLDAGELAPQTDNVATRMLLWPHPLIPEDGFIAPRHDETLVAKALGRLRRFAFVHVCENPELSCALSRWLGHAVSLRRENVTAPVAGAYAAELDSELTERADTLLRRRCRLDDRLWSAFAARALGLAGVDALQTRTRAEDDARFATLLRADPPAPLEAVV